MTSTRPLLCETVTGATTTELRAARDRVTDADLVELRLDTVRDPDAAGALAGRRLPAIVTCRAEWEGGHFKGSEEERRQLLQEALNLGAEYVDVEWRAGFDDLLAHTSGRRIVLSFHDYESVPPDLGEVFGAMRATGAEVVKIAVQANRLSDCLPLAQLATSARGRQVLIAMGEAGLATRILPSRFGSAWTYAGSVKSAGQLSAAELVDEYQFRSLRPEADVYGLVGRPVSHSVSPAMHNAAFRATQVDAVYLPLPAADADDFVQFAHGMKLKGASVTIPYKVALQDRVDESDAIARRIGAINTIRISGGRSIGTNTDAAGFLRPLQDQRVPLRNMRAAILGSGGSARAVAVALASSGAEVTIHARNRFQCEEVARLAAAKTGVWPVPRGSWDLLVNCTPLGMHPREDDSPMEASALTGSVVYDLVYNPPVTRLLRDAALAGCQTIGGLDMLVAQALEQFQWWTATRAPASVMRDAALRRLSEFSSNENHVV